MFLWFHVRAHLNCVHYMSTEKPFKKQRQKQDVFINLYVNHNQYKISYDQSDISLSYLDIVCCGIPANCLRSQLGHNYALHWIRSSRCRPSLRLCYWGHHLSCPRGLGQLQPSMAGRKKSPCSKVLLFSNSLCTVTNTTSNVWVDKISITCFVLLIFFKYYLLHQI